MSGLSSSRPSVSRALALALAVMGILVLGDLNSRMADALQLERDSRLLESEVTSLETQQAQLEAQIAAVAQDQTVEEWARREAKMVREGEHLILPIPAGEDARASVPPSEGVLPLPSPWEVWWALLFGG
jgi:cell division protein FtsB